MESGEGIESSWEQQVVFRLPGLVESGEGIESRREHHNCPASWTGEVESGEGIERKLAEEEGDEVQQKVESGEGIERGPRSGPPRAAIRVESGEGIESCRFTL